MLKVEGFEGERKKYGRTKLMFHFLAKSDCRGIKIYPPITSKNALAWGAEKQIKRGEMK